MEEFSASTAKTRPTLLRVSQTRELNAARMALSEQAALMDASFGRVLMVAGEGASSGSVEEHAAAFVGAAKELEAQLLALREQGVGRELPLADEVQALRGELAAKNALIAKYTQKAAEWESKLPQ
jgi:hypothetical protein